MDMEEIYTTYATPVYKYLLTLTADPTLSEELTQETFYQALKSIHRYNGKCKLLVWLCQIGKHLFWDHLKREKRHRRVDWEQLEAEPNALSQEMPSLALETREGAKKLYSELHKLPEPYRELMLLRISGELSFRDIGEIMGHTENWARVSFYRAKCRLLKGMEEDG